MDVKQLLVVLIILIFLIYLRHISTNEAIFMKSNFNKKEYLVQNEYQKEEASYILSVIHKRILLFKNYLEKHKEDFPKYRPYIEQFCKRINNLVLQENSPYGKYTSYTVNKGDEIAVCLRSKKTYELHDLNLIMYVIIHELAHVACPEVDHTDLFKDIFVFFLRIAIFLKIYKDTNYKINPTEYCGLIINEYLLK
uniref:Uncharacterized protein n=1 Tax=viral metagenome TaxID=1070528 RepID=A0A6C0LS01_9ZZZZ